MGQNSFPDLVDPEVWICRDHRSRGKVDSLPHEVTTDTTFLALQALSEGLERLSRSLRLLRLPRPLVVEQRRYLRRRSNEDDEAKTKQSKSDNK